MQEIKATILPLKELKELVKYAGFDSENVSEKCRWYCVNKKPTVLINCRKVDSGVKGVVTERSVIEDLINLSLLDEGNYIITYE